MRSNTPARVPLASELHPLPQAGVVRAVMHFDRPATSGLPSMVLLRARLRVDPAHRAKVVRSLYRILGPLRASAGCLSCHLYADCEDDNILLFTQEWIDEEELLRHLRADSARILLSALDCAIDPPEVHLNTLTDGHGIEFIARCLNAEWPDA